MVFLHVTRDVSDDRSWNDNYRGTDRDRGARRSNLLSKSREEDYLLSPLDELVQL